MSYTSFYIIYISIIFLAALMGFVNYRKENRKLLPLVILLGYIFVSQVVYYLMGKYVRNNVPVDHVNTPVYFAGWGLFFYHTIEDPRVKQYIKWATISLICCSIVNTCITGFNAAPWVFVKIASILNLIMGGLLLVQMLDLPSKENAFSNSFFLVALAVVWFNIISSLSFFLYDLIIINKTISKFLSSLHFISNYIYYSILMLAMVFQKKLNNNVGRISQGTH